MRRLLAATVLLLATLPAQAQFKGYFGIGALSIAALKEPAWVRKQDENRIRYLCVDFARCPLPTGIEIKGVVRVETLPEAFESGALSPAKLKAAGDARATLPGQAFVSADAITIAGVKGVHLEAEAEAGGKLYYVTRWIGQGNRLLDLKVTARDLKLARELMETASNELVPQVFPAK
jgi:hypothetical protein